MSASKELIIEVNGVKHGFIKCEQQPKTNLGVGRAVSIEQNSENSIAKTLKRMRDLYVSK